MRLLPWRNSGVEEPPAPPSESREAAATTEVAPDERASRKLIDGGAKKKRLEGSRGANAGARGFHRIGRRRARTTGAFLALLFFASLGGAAGARQTDAPPALPASPPAIVLPAEKPTTLFQLQLNGSLTAPFHADRAQCRADANRDHPAPPPLSSEPYRGPQFPIDGGQYNIGYDANWSIFDQGANPEHNSDFTGDRPSNASHPRGHHGVDVFGPRGAPIVAPVAGVVEFSVNPAGGNALWVHDTAGGEHYYLAHLDSFAPGIQDGQRVEAGTELGTLGNTGNASDNAPHLHFERHPGNEDNDAVDPLGVLLDWRAAEQANANAEAGRAEEHRAAVASRDALVGIDATVCTLVSALEANPAGLGGTQVGSQYHLTESALRGAGRQLGLDAGAVDTLVSQLGVLGYANGAPNSVARSVTLGDLRAIRDQIDGGKSFDEVVQLAQNERAERSAHLHRRLS